MIGWVAVPSAMMREPRLIKMLSDALNASVVPASMINVGPVPAAGAGPDSTFVPTYRLSAKNVDPVDARYAEVHRQRIRLRHERRVIRAVRAVVAALTRRPRDRIGRARIGRASAAAATSARADVGGGQVDVSRAACRERGGQRNRGQSSPEGHRVLLRRIGMRWAPRGAFVSAVALPQRVGTGATVGAPCLRKMKLRLRNCYSRVDARPFAGATACASRLGGTRR